MLAAENTPDIPAQLANDKNKASETNHASEQKQPFKQDEQITLALIKPDAMAKCDDIKNLIRDAGFQIVKEKKMQLTLEQAQEFYKEHQGKPFYPELTQWMSSAPIEALVLQNIKGVPSVQAWRDIMGPTDAQKARETHPKSVRALFGTDGSKNATHGSDSVESAEREIQLLFGVTQENNDTQTEAKHPTSADETTSEAAGTAVPANGDTKPAAAAAASLHVAEPTTPAEPANAPKTTQEYKPTTTAQSSLKQQETAPSSLSSSVPPPAASGATEAKPLSVDSNTKNAVAENNTNQEKTEPSAPKDDVKPEVKPDAKSEATFETKSETKSKSEAQSEAKFGAKSEVQQVDVATAPKTDPVPQTVEGGSPSQQPIQNEVKDTQISDKAHEAQEKPVGTKDLTKQQQESLNKPVSSVSDAKTQDVKEDDKAESNAKTGQDDKPKEVTSKEPATLDVKSNQENKPEDRTGAKPHEERAAEGTHQDKPQEKVEIKSTEDEASKTQPQDKPEEKVDLKPQENKTAGTETKESKQDELKPQGDKEDETKYTKAEEVDASQGKAEQGKQQEVAKAKEDKPKESTKDQPQARGTVRAALNIFNGKTAPATQAPSKPAVGKKEDSHAKEASTPSHPNENGKVPEAGESADKPKEQVSNSKPSVVAAEADAPAPDASSRDTSSNASSEKKSERAVKPRNAIAPESKAKPEARTKLTKKSVAPPATAIPKTSKANKLPPSPPGEKQQTKPKPATVKKPATAKKPAVAAPPGQEANKKPTAKTSSRRSGILSRLTAPTASSARKQQQMPSSAEEQAPVNNKPKQGSRTATIAVKTARSRIVAPNTTTDKPPVAAAKTAQ